MIVGHMVVEKKRGNCGRISVPEDEASPMTTQDKNMTDLDNIDFRNLPPADFLYEGIVRKIAVETYPCQSDEGYGDWVPEN